MILRPGQRVAMLPADGLQVVSGRATLHQAGGWWSDFSANLVGAWDALAAASYAASKVDLSGNGNHLTETDAAVTWDATDGWQFTAANTDAFRTQVTPTGSATTLMVQFTDAAAAGVAIGALSALDGSSDFCIMPDGTGIWGDVVHYQTGSNERNVAPKLAAGTLALSQWQGYRDGSADGSAITSSSPTFLYPLPLGCAVRRDDPGGAGVLFDYYFTGNIQRAAIWDAALDGSTIAAVHAAWTA